MKKTGGAVRITLALALFVGVTAAMADPAPLDLREAGASLASQPGAVLDLREPSVRHDLPGLRQKVEACRSGGHRLWIVLVPDGTPLSDTLKGLAGRLGPQEGDAVVVASRDGVMARVPALAAQPTAINDAFEASRRALAVDLESGLAAFLDHLDTAQRRRGQQAGLALGVIALLAFGLLARAVWSWAVFRQRRRQWDKDDHATVQDLVEACQLRLQRLASSGASSYDAHYEELRRFQSLPRDEAAAALELLRDRLDHALNGPSSESTP